MKKKNIRVYCAPREFGRTYAENEQMKKQIIDLKKYIVKLENKLKEYDRDNKFLLRMLYGEVFK